MKESILKKNYIVLESWMITDLNLKGVSLILYALIYGFSQAKNQLCTCGIEYMAAWANSTERGVKKALNELENKGYIVAVKAAKSDMRRTAYVAKIGAKSAPISNIAVGTRKFPIRKKLGELSSPNSTKNRGTLVQKIGELSSPILYKDYINNIYTDLSVSQRACARQNETDFIEENTRKKEVSSENEKAFYCECVAEALQNLDSSYNDEIELRINDLVGRLKKLETVAINKISVPVTDILQSLFRLLKTRTEDDILGYINAGCKTTVKNKFLYSVAAIYNAEKQF